MPSIMLSFVLVQEKEGKDKLKSRAEEAKLDVKKLFEAVPDVDFDLPSVADFLKEEGLEQVLGA